MPLVDEQQLVDDVLAALQTRPSALQTRPSAQPANACGTGDGTPVPARPGQRPLEDVLIRRQSERTFRAQPVVLDDLEFVVAHARGVTARHWTAETRHLAVLVLAYDVEPLASGCYVAHTAGGLARVGSGGPPPALPDRYTRAPVLVAICGDLLWACSPEGCGYGGLLMAAGALGHVMWLSAVSIDLAVSVYGGVDEGVTRLARTVAPVAGMAHLFTIAIGVAA